MPRRSHAKRRSLEEPRVGYVCHDGYSNPILYIIHFSCSMVLKAVPVTAKDFRAEAQHHAQLRSSKLQESKYFYQSGHQDTGDKLSFEARTSLIAFLPLFARRHFMDELGMSGNMDERSTWANLIHVYRNLTARYPIAMLEMQNYLKMSRC